MSNNSKLDLIWLENLLKNLIRIFLPKRVSAVVSYKGLNFLWLRYTFKMGQQVRSSPAEVKSGGGFVCVRRGCAHSLFAHLSTHAQPPPLFATRISLTWELLTSSCITRLHSLYQQQLTHVMITYLLLHIYAVGIRVTLWYDNRGLSACTVILRDVAWWKLSDDQIDIVIRILFIDKRRHGHHAGKL